MAPPTAPFPPQTPVAPPPQPPAGPPRTHNPREPTGHARGNRLPEHLGMHRPPPIALSNQIRSTSPVAGHGRLDNGRPGDIGAEGNGLHQAGDGGAPAPGWAGAGGADATAEQTVEVAWDLPINTSTRTQAEDGGGAAHLHQPLALRSTGRDEAPAARWGVAGASLSGQLRLRPVSSMTNEVWRELSSVPVKVMVDVVPARDETSKDRRV